MKTYTHKPIEVEALQWTGNNTEEMNKFLKSISITVYKDQPFYIRVDGPAFHKVEIGDYVVKDNFAKYYKINAMKFNTNFTSKT